MSEKTLQATPKRRQDARKKGQVLKSQEMVSAFMLLGFVALLKYWLPTMITKMSGLFQYVYGLPFDWNVQSISTLMINLLWVGIQVVGPIFIVGALIATASNYLQVKSLFTLEPLKPQLSRISLISGAKRMFGVKAWVELFKSLLKVILIGYFLYATIRDNLQVYPALQQLSIAQAAMYIGNALMSLAWKISISFVLIAVIDFLYQWWDYEKNLRMSHEEMKQEFKQSEGNPQIKSEIRRKQREMAMSRMMQDLKSADVVVTNPTHFAVALRYDAKKNPAPYVVAKGADQVALRIRANAKEYGIIILENKPLARALYAQVEIGQAVPADLYKAVAEVLAFVYRLKKKRPTA
ncbi:flagellar biosynthesis protein FlhB [Desulfitobacterium metallireducens]|uniref:Flagellar biosynthetic protein FlhB n=1 Tax=Desulfitobacterium metallireducens DSM 15288 TaxID=871968 RepID=W0EA92_9FIRM|nr:flagellar biosynthesis protein FlhB [Desulfitobacterium metallireducens]AHF07775.1 flagellar biosynthesis protein FlhB [Desulfitobacterium metallireducens DSM 15288]